MSTLGDVKPFSYYSSLGGENSLVPTVDKYHFIIVTKSPENTARLIDPPCHPLPLVQFPVATSGPPCLLTLYSAVQCVEASYRGIGGGPLLYRAQSCVPSPLGALQRGRRIGTARARTRRIDGMWMVATADEWIGDGRQMASRRWSATFCATNGVPDGFFLAGGKLAFPR